MRPGPLVSSIALQDGVDTRDHIQEMSLRHTVPNPSLGSLDLASKLGQLRSNEWAYVRVADVGSPRLSVARGLFSHEILEPFEVGALQRPTVPVDRRSRSQVSPDRVTRVVEELGQAAWQCSRR